MRLRVVSYNIHRAIGLDRRFRPERIVEILRHHNPDVALLQEVDDGAPRSRSRDLASDLARELSFSYYAVGHNVTLRRGRYGNATLSRHPILRERNIDLTVGPRKRRGCQHTTLCAEKIVGHPHTIEVFNLHLGLSARERTRQLGKLVHSSEFLALSPHSPCIVGGDFNDWRSMLHPIFTEILDFRCATRPSHGLNGAIRTFPAFSPTGGLDKIYLRGPVRSVRARRCRLAVSRVASDHLPIIADLELRAP